MPNITDLTNSVGKVCVFQAGSAQWMDTRPPGGHVENGNHHPIR